MRKDLEITGLKFSELMTKKGEYIKVKFYIDNNMRTDATGVEVSFRTIANVYDKRKNKISNKHIKVGKIKRRRDEEIVIYLKSDRSLMADLRIIVEAENADSCSENVRQIYWTDTNPVVEYLEDLAKSFIDDVINFDLKLEGEILKDKDQDDNFIVRIGAGDISIDGLDDFDTSAEISVSAVEFGMEDLDSDIIKEWAVKSLTGNASAELSVDESGFSAGAEAKATIAEFSLGSRALKVGELFEISAAGSLDVGTIGAKLRAELEKGHSFEGSSLTLGIGLGAALGFSLEITISW